jgi:hypothetical protein
VLFQLDFLVDAFELLAQALEHPTGVSHARSELEAWNWAESILEPWVESTTAIGSEELTRVMTEALDEVRRQVARHDAELRRAMATLEA